MSQDELKSCRVFFNNFDRTKSGTINGWELQIALEAMGQNPSEDDIKASMLALGAGSGDSNKVGLIDFSQFLKAIQMQRDVEKRSDVEADFVAAFVAMGGGDRSRAANNENRTPAAQAIADRSGVVLSDKLRKVIKEDFALTFKIDELLEDHEIAVDGQLQYQEFKKLFS